jgi:hypothetical protein
MKYSCLSLAFIALACGGCTGPIIIGSTAGMMVASRPGDGAPADTASQIPAHESWCYKTMGEPECYTHAQDVAPERLINVEPQSRYPLDLASYHEAVQGRADNAGASSQPIVLQPAATVPVEKGVAQDTKTQTP